MSAPVFTLPMRDALEELLEQGRTRQEIAAELSRMFNRPIQPNAVKWFVHRTGLTRDGASSDWEDGIRASSDRFAQALAGLRP